MKETIFTVLVAAVIIFVILGIESGFSQGEEKVNLEFTKIVRKLDEVLANQTEMFRQLNEIKQELAVIKIRASR